MNSVRLHQYGGADQLRFEAIDPPRCGAGEVLVAVAAAAVNPVDAKLRSGLFASVMPLELPYIPGGDFSGAILAVGVDVDPARVGQRVMGMLNVLRGGAYAEQLVVAAQHAVPIPEGLDLVDAAALPMGAMTGLDLVEIGLEVEAGQRVAIVGAAGSVGRAAAYAAAACGAQVVALVRTHPQTPISGAAQTILLTDWEALVEAGPFDAIDDTVGGDEVDRLATHLRPGGRFGSVVQRLPADAEARGISVRHVVVDSAPAKLARLADAVVSGALVLPTSQRLPLSGAAQAHTRIESGRVGGKILLIP